MNKAITGWLVVGFATLGLIAPAVAQDTEADATTDAKGAIELVVFTPPDDEDQAETIYCSMSIDGWPAGGRPLNRLSAGIYSAAVDLRGAAVVEYKFLRQQNWETVEKGNNGGEIPNRRLRLNPQTKVRRVVHKINSWADKPQRNRGQVVFQFPSAAPEETLTGDIITHRQLHFAKLDNRRDVLVWLPPGYATHPERRYPVLYMLDGQNVFNEATSFKGQEWAADETATQLIEQGLIQPLIIVAVYNTPNREAEHVPRFDDPEQSAADEFLGFLTDKVKPLIDHQYRTLTAPEHNVLLGASYGGLFSLYAACHGQEHFGGYAVISPSVQVERGKIVDHVEETLDEPNLQLWIELGAGDGLRRMLSSYGGYIASCRQLRDLLKAKGWEEGNNLHYSEIDGVFHDEAAWATRMEPLLKFFFPAEVGAE